jgi:hypothetical protein
LLFLVLQLGNRHLATQTTPPPAANPPKAQAPPPTPPPPPQKVSFIRKIEKLIFHLDEIWSVKR